MVIQEEIASLHVPMYSTALGRASHYNVYLGRWRHAGTRGL